MATSGTNAFNLTVEGVIEKALELVGGELSSAEDLRQARISLNLLLIDMQNRGHPLAELEQKSFTVASASASYTLSAGITDVLDVVVTRSSVDTALERITLMEYHKIPTKTEQGLPTQYAIDRDRDQVTMHIYLTPENSTDVIDYWCITEIEDVGAYTNNLDVNKRYLPAVTFGLAYFIGLSRSLDPALRNELKANYLDALNSAALEDRDRSSFHLKPFGYFRR